MNARPANITFSVLEGLAGTTSTVLTVDDDFEIDEDGNFVITVSRESDRRAESPSAHQRLDDHCGT